MGTLHEQIPNIEWGQLYAEKSDLSELEQPIQEEEIKRVINTWPNNKTPGPDGFSGEFYKAFIEIVTPDIKAVISYTVEEGNNLDPLNGSYTVLIPKTQNSIKMKDFRPIILINGIQRIFPKILSNRNSCATGHVSIRIDGYIGYHCVNYKGHLT